MAIQRLSRKILNICIVCIIIVIILFTAIMLILNYDENGETNMPFQISKISIISTVDGEDVENSEYKWYKNVIQNNDVYIYIEKNKDYKKQETIESVKIDNFNVKQSNQNGEFKIYKQTESDTEIFQNIDENIVQELEYKGAKQTNTKKLEISNQGGVLSFRCANNNIGTYMSNDDEEINYDRLLSKLNLKEEDLKAEINFNVTITLNSGKIFKAEGVTITVPNQDIIEKGRVGQEYTELEDIVFKRIEN